MPGLSLLLVLQAPSQKGMARCAERLPFSCLLSACCYTHMRPGPVDGFMLLVDTQRTYATARLCMPFLLQHLLASMVSNYLMSDILEMLWDAVLPLKWEASLWQSSFEEPHVLLFGGRVRMTVRLHGCLPDVGLNANAHQPYQLNII